MRNKGYSKCNTITKAMRNLNKKSRVLLSYSDLKKIYVNVHLEIL